MVQSQGTPSADGDDLGQTLARMRRAKGLTGEELGGMVDLSQPTISRLERGIGLPNPDDVGRIARALDADEAETHRLVDLAKRMRSLLVEWHPNPMRLASRQRSAFQRESTARTLRSFEPALVPGPLQTSEYARAVLSAFQRLITPGVDVSASRALPQAVSARLQRQEMLADRTKTFHFLMAETVLANQICPPEEMAAQIRRLRDIGQPNLTISIIRADRLWTVPPMHGFTLLDEQVVTVDLFSNGITADDRTNGHFYGQVFEALHELSVEDVGEVLNEYVDHYLDEAQRQRRG